MAWEATLAKAVKSTPKVLKVVIADFEVLHFFDDWLEVREGTYGSHGWSVGGTQQPTCCGKHQGVFDGLQGNRSIVQLSGQQTVLTTNASRSAWSLAVGIENLANIVIPVAAVGFHILRLSLADRAATGR